MSNCDHHTVMLKQFAHDIPLKRGNPVSLGGFVNTRSLCSTTHTQTDPANQSFGKHTCFIAGSETDKIVAQC